MITCYILIEKHVNINHLFICHSRSRLSVCGVGVEGGPRLSTGPLPVSPGQLGKNAARPRTEHVLEFYKCFPDPFQVQGNIVCDSPSNPS